MAFNSPCDPLLCPEVLELIYDSYCLSSILPFRQDEGFLVTVPCTVSSLGWALGPCWVELIESFPVGRRTFSITPIPTT